MVLETLLYPVFGFVLVWPPWLGVLFISFVLTLITTIVYKYTTNQSEMKRLKEETKMYQKKIKELKNNPKKAMEVQKQAMSVNMEYMKHSFRPMIYTMLPLIIIFGWLNASYNYNPILPNVPLNVSVATQGLEGKEVTLEAYPEMKLLSEAKQTVIGEAAQWTIQGEKGDYKLVFKQNGNAAEKIIIITGKLKYENPVSAFKNNPIKQVIVHQKELKPLGNLNILGWYPGWIGIYIIASIAFGSLLRKVMKVY